MLTDRDVKDLYEWLEGEKYILPEFTNTTTQEERDFCYEISRNRMIDKTISKIQELNKESGLIRRFMNSHYGVSKSVKIDNDNPYPDISVMYPPISNEELMKVDKTGVVTADNIPLNAIREFYGLDPINK